MSRDNGKKYPKTIESKNSYLRIRAPEHLDVALEGLIRKVLKEQPKMDDIYVFAADYFEMLLKIREKSGIRKLSVQDICPHHNEEDANEMIKVASTFTKRKKELKPTTRTYKAISLKHADHRQERKGTKTRDGDVKNGFNTVLPIVNEHPEFEDAKQAESGAKNEKPESEPEDNDLDFDDEPKKQEPSEKIIEAREVILEEDGEDEENAVETVGDIREIRDKIQAVENEIKSLEKKESESGGNGDGETAEDVKMQGEDGNTSEARPIIEETMQESGDAKLSDENEVKIEDVAAEDDNKGNDEEKACTEIAQEAGTEDKSVAEEVQEVKVESTVQETKEEEQKVLVTTEDVKDPKNDDETAKEETQGTAIEQNDGTTTTEETHDTEIEQNVDKTMAETEGTAVEQTDDKAATEAEGTAVEQTDDKTATEAEGTAVEQTDDKTATEAESTAVEQTDDKAATEAEGTAVEQTDDKAATEAESTAVEQTDDKAATETEGTAVEQADDKTATETEGTAIEQTEEFSTQIEEQVNDNVGVQEVQEEKPKDDVKVEETQEDKQESEVQQVEEAESSVGVTMEESPETVPSADGKTEESETKPEDENPTSETSVNEAKLEEIADHPDHTRMEGVTPNAESAVVGMRSIDPTQAKEADLMGGEGIKDDKTETEGFIDLEKRTEEVQNAEPSVEPTEVGPADPAEDNVDKETDAVVINAPSVEEEAVEENTTVPISEGNDAEKTESAAQEAIAVAGGLGAAAVVLGLAKRELTDSNPEENPEKEEKTEEANPEDVLLGAEPKEEMTLTEEVQKFLDRERQHSSHDKDAEVLNVEEKTENEKAETQDVEVASETVPVSLARAALPIKEESPEKGQSGPSDVEAEGDEHEREGSTTSDEIEFEISPLKYTETTVDTAKITPETDTVKVPAGDENDPEEKNVEEEKTNVKAEPRIVLELNRSESEDQTTDSAEADGTEQVKAFLAVPEAISGEYPGRKIEGAILQETQPEGQSRSKRSVEPSGEESVNAEEVIIDCANVGNEIIQTGEVQKVELIEGDEDILQVHLTTTVETVQESGDSLFVQMTSKIDPIIEVSMETKVESPVLDDKIRLIRAAVVIQNGFRRFQKRKVTGETLDVSTDELDTSTVSETKLDLSMQTILKDASSRESGSSFSSSATKINNRDFRGRNLNRSATRTILETHSLESIRKITPLKTRSLSTVRYGVADFEIWNQLVKELEEAATTIQSSYRGDWKGKKVPGLAKQFRKSIFTTVPETPNVLGNK